MTALDGVDLEIEEGAAAHLTDPSGSGKSTVPHGSGGKDRPDSGAEVGNQELTYRQLDAHRRRIGFVFQRFHLTEPTEPTELPAPTPLTVLDNVLAPMLPRRVDFDRGARATELLDSVGLTARADALPSELSGGQRQRQRVAVARALINRPPLLPADERTAAEGRQTAMRPPSTGSTAPWTKLDRSVAR